MACATIPAAGAVAPAAAAPQQADAAPAADLPGRPSPQPRAPRPPQPRPALAAQGAAPPSSPQQETLYLFDALPYAYRLAQGLGAARLPDALGTDTSLAHMLVGQLLGMLLQRTPRPTHAAVVVDAPTLNFRHELWPRYKAQRAPPPEGLHANLARSLSVFDAMGLPVLCVPGVEADDVIGTLAARAAAAGMRVVIVSPDKDFFQVLSPQVSLLRPSKTGPQLYTLHDFTADKGLSDARLWADVLALQGDSADNVPGVNGIGANTALQLVRANGGVEDVLAAEDYGCRLNQNQREMLASGEGRAAARLAKQLVTIETDLQLPPVRDLDLEECRLRMPRDGGAALNKCIADFELSWLASRVHQLFRQ